MRVRIVKPMRLGQRLFFFAGPFLASDEAAAAFLDARDPGAERTERRLGRWPCPDAPDPSDPTMSFQSVCPL